MNPQLTKLSDRYDLIKRRQYYQRRRQDPVKREIHRNDKRKYDNRKKFARWMQDLISGKLPLSPQEQQIYNRL